MKQGGNSLTVTEKKFVALPFTVIPTHSYLNNLYGKDIGINSFQYNCGEEGRAIENW